MISCNPQVPLHRKYLPLDFAIRDRKLLEFYYADLAGRSIDSVHALEQWLRDVSELSQAIAEDMAWRYIRMTCDTTNEQYTQQYNSFLSEIYPLVMEQSNILDKKVYESAFRDSLDQKKYKVFLRSIKNNIELHRDANVPLFAEEQQREKEFSRISGEMTIVYNNEEYTLQKAANFLYDTRREVRETIYFLMAERRKADAENLQKLLSDLIEKRQQIAKNTGYANYRDFRHIQLGRFDYTVDDCLLLHEVIRQEVCPIQDMILASRKKALGYETLKPWDIQVDPQGNEALVPFSSVDELVDKTITCFTSIRPVFGRYIQQMKDAGYLDLASRKGKAPGGYNYPLYESNMPFIFMNATGNLKDLETMMHEGGHAIHTFLTADMELMQFKETPAEVAELASMSMELIAMEHWDIFFPKKEDLKRAKREMLENLIAILPWIATVDKFQHWLYTHPGHSHEERLRQWMKIYLEFSGKEIDIQGCEDVVQLLWQKQIHIFEIPFYYIEYGIAQLGAIAVWRNYLQNKEKAIDQYIRALSLGYSVPIPEIYDAAGITFSFSREYVHELMSFVKQQLTKL